MQFENCYCIDGIYEKKLSLGSFVFFFFFFVNDLYIQPEA